jgi:hypothetical protein
MDATIIVHLSTLDYGLFLYFPSAPPLSHVLRRPRRSILLITASMNRTDREREREGIVCITQRGDEGYEYMYVRT